jgi:predicted Zn-dependent protease
MAALLATTAQLMAATPGPELPDPGSVAGISKEQQVELGQKVKAEVYKQMPVLPDSSPEAQYVRKLGNKLAAVIPPEVSWPFEFHAIPQKEINAFAIPGGPMFVNVGTIVAADNEAQLVGVMAHEMAHVYMQHSAKQAGKQSLTQGIAGILGGLLGQGTLGSLAKLGIGIGAGLVSLKYSRGDEAQADAVGAIIAYKAGYDPRALASFFEKLEKEGGSGPQMLSDHPNPGNRRAAIENEARSWPSRSFQNTSADFTRVKRDASHMKTYTAEEIAAGAKQGTWARQNAQSGSSSAAQSATGQPASPAAAGDIANVSLQQVKPSGRFTTFDHAAFSIQYPDNWRAAGDAGSNVTIAPPAGAAEGAVAYGVVVGAAPAASGNLDQATQQLIAGLQQSNEGMQVEGSLQSTSVNGVEGRSATLRGTSPVQQNGQPLPERDWLITLPREGGLLYIVFIAPEKAFEQLRPTYENMLRSVKLK